MAVVSAIEQGSALRVLQRNAALLQLLMYLQTLMLFGLETSWHH